MVLRELREALDGGVDIDLGSQLVLLLAVILKDFLRSIPGKLLVTNLYAEWMTAMKRTSKQEKGGRQVACSKPPPSQAAAVPPPAYWPQCVHQQDELQQYGHRVGPNLLSPANEDLLPLELLLEVPDKVNMLVEFLIENCRKIFGEKMAGLSSPPVEELPAPMDRSTELPLEEQCGPAGEADVEHQAKAFLDAPPSLLILQKAAGADTVMGSETAEAPVVLPPATPETTVDSLGCAEELKSPSEESR
ncbi:T-cell activation Rho GTPase-activating protein-like [Morphnus guianensis]